MLQQGREIAPSVSWEILVHVKRTGGISVNELAACLKMSYMGVKQHCDALKRRGYLDTWRRPKATGRPEKIFRPTAKLDLALPNWGNDLCLGVLTHSALTHGEAEPERLLNSFLQQKAVQWAAKLKAKTLRERAAEFLKLRTIEGWMGELVAGPEELLIIEHHSPLSEIAKKYPVVWAIESRALERCFNTPVLRRFSEQNKPELVFLATVSVQGAPPAEVPAPVAAENPVPAAAAAAEPSSAPPTSPQAPPAPSVISLPTEQAAASPAAMPAKTSRSRAKTKSPARETGDLWFDLDLS